MAVYTTTLVELTSNDNSKTWAISGHTALDPYLLVQKRRAPSNPASNLESNLSVIKQTEDAEGVVLPSRIVFEARVKYPKLGVAADVTAALAVFREYVASDEFTAVVDNQYYFGP